MHTKGVRIVQGMPRPSYANLSMGPVDKGYSQRDKQ